METARTQENRWKQDTGEPMETVRPLENQWGMWRTWRVNGKCYRPEQTIEKTNQALENRYKQLLRHGEIDGEGKEKKKLGQSVRRTYSTTTIVSEPCPNRQTSHHPLQSFPFFAAQQLNRRERQTGRAVIRVTWTRPPATPSSDQIAFRRFLYF